MRSHERSQGIIRAPRLVWDVLGRGRYEFVYDRMPMVASGMSWRKRLNLFRAGANLLHRRLQPWSMPLHMQFELANYCNLRCPVCPAGTRSVSRQPMAMDVELFRRVMDEVGPYLLTTCLWAWGEPTFHPRLKDILRAARTHDVITLFSTNGQQLNHERVLEALIEEPPDYLVVALDGLTDQTNSVYRVGARMSPILEGVKRLAEMKRRRGQRMPVLNMRFIVMRHNEHEAQEVMEFAKQHEFELLSLRTLCTYVEPVYDPEAGRRLRPDRVASEAGGKFYCLHPFWFPTLFADGTVVLCEQDYNAELGLGRVEGDVSFTRLWKSKKAARLRRLIRDRMAEVGFCHNCPYKDHPTSDFNSNVYVLAEEARA
ncbi:MAG: radical SAM/SPASM domain-containing protein [Rhodospirillales bacterium]